MALLMFVDTETTGLMYEYDQIWHIYAEVAFTGDTRIIDSFERLIYVDPEKIEALPQKFQDKYNEIWNNPWFNDKKVTNGNAGREFLDWLTHGVNPDRGKITLIAANPSFDSRMMMYNLISQQNFFKFFEYHMIDIEAFALGYLRNIELRSHGIKPNGTRIPREAFVPFKSDDLTREILGEEYLLTGHKHDARSDVYWLKDMWLAMNNGKF